MGKKGSKLHEILAVEADAEGASNKMMAETSKTFINKAAHFLGQHRSCTMYNDTDIAPPDEHLEMVTTIDEKLRHTHAHIIRYFDIVLQKESTNQLAVADLIVDGDVISQAVPATFLLGMEKRLKNLREMYDKIPTLQPGKDWQLDLSHNKEGVFKDIHPEKKLKTAQTFKSKVLYEATKEHPAQLEKWTEQVPVGEYTTDTWSGMMSPAQKSALLGRTDKLIRAVKQARQRANSVEVNRRTIGKELIDYILAV